MFHIEKDIEKLVGELEDEKRKLDDVVKDYEKCDYEETAKKKEQASYLKQMSRSEGNIAKKKIELDKKVVSSYGCHFFYNMNHLLSMTVFLEKCFFLGTIFPFVIIMCYLLFNQ